MSGATVAVLGFALAVAFGVWIASRADGLADVEVLPVHCRRRVAWWHRHAKYGYAGCAALAATAAVIELVASVG